MPEEPPLYSRLAAAYVRGKLTPAPAAGSAPPLAALEEAEVEAILRQGREAGLRLHRFKRTMELARVARVLGVLRGIGPVDLLDVGSGRGAFLWPLLDAFPGLPVTAVDRLAYRAADIQAVRDGGVEGLTAICGDLTELDLDDGSFDVVTLLEVLEHIPDPARALAQACRLARRFVVLSVPSKADENPEHIHLFSAATLEPLLRTAGAARVTFDYVPGHLGGRQDRPLMERIRKYPRTPHIEGSGLQTGDEDLAVAGFGELAGKHLVVEEKMDGANCGVSFDPRGRLKLQSRGHYLTGGPRERQFHRLKAWASRFTAELWELLGDRYVLYGEWCYAKHTLFYNALPSYLMEFDLYDTREDVFLSTARRMSLLRGAPFVVSVHVLHAGPLPSLAALQALVGPSRFIAPGFREQLRDAALSQKLDPERTLRETDPTGWMEGLYVKTEDADTVTGRYKYVRSGFLQTVLDSESHWLDRPLLPNRLREGGSLW